MCGQLGVAGTVTPAGETAFKRLLIFNAVRGTDSTGAAAVKRNQIKDGKPEILVAKEVGHAFNLLEIKRPDEVDFGDIVSGTQRALLGHCRASTRGATNRRNAHPFAFKDVVGTHNGTLDHSSHNALSGKGRLDTDSECIFNEIQTYGIEDTVKKFRDVADAYALVWYDARSDSMNFLKNDRRPLYYGFDKTNTQLFWSSEFYHLAGGMEGVPNDQKFYSFTDDCHYQWKIPAVGQAFGKAHIVKREPEKNPLVTGHSQNWKQHGASGTASGSDPNRSDLHDSWLCPHTFFFKKYDQKLRQYVYSQNKTGVYYPTVQEAWNKLSEFQKQVRISNKEVPYEITLKAGSNHAEAQGDLKLDDPEKKANVVVLSENRNSLEDVKKKVREKRLGEYLKSDSSPMVWRDDHRVVLWNIQKKQYSVLTFKGYKLEEGWSKEDVKVCPDYVPFTELDVSARHQFVHIGKKKNKVTSYKGFDGILLVKQTFEKLMSSGCTGCDRVPHWGNDVTFVTRTNFLCEHCSRDPMTVRTMIALGKQKQVEK